MGAQSLSRRMTAQPWGASCPSARRAPFARTFCRLTRVCLPPRGLSASSWLVCLYPVYVLEAITDVSCSSHVVDPTALPLRSWLTPLVAFRLTVQSSWWWDHTEEFLTIEAPLPLQPAAVLYWGLILVQQKRDFRSQMFSLQIKYPLAKCVIKVSECLSG